MNKIIMFFKQLSKQANWHTHRVRVGEQKNQNQNMMTNLSSLIHTHKLGVYYHRVRLKKTHWICRSIRVHVHYCFIWSDCASQREWVSFVWEKLNRRVPKWCSSLVLLLLILCSSSFFTSFFSPSSSTLFLSVYLLPQQFIDKLKFPMK